MTTDRERFAEALAIDKLHGDRARLFVAQRIGAFALAGDAGGVTRFNAIACRLDVLIAAGRLANA
ncbi:hypothetical protein SAMN06295912_12628 [Sphingomonas laterariae]|uniref:Uncharacterized protein n=1 Tax=Edaphosphingomonas laterariae TaxID=861865 RepID=A0A239IQ25_9SPHN|nr:hypothetical protein [Sphingomonas laterariae]SNS95665.1 hypothetical protein SAMN06295912_12628 [Sphingomonas laterariae]